MRRSPNVNFAKIIEIDEYLKNEGEGDGKPYLDDVKNSLYCLCRAMCTFAKIKNVFHYEELITFASNTISCLRKITDESASEDAEAWWCPQECPRIR